MSDVLALQELGVEQGVDAAAYPTIGEISTASFFNCS
ncbi:class III lanthipeptide [Rhizohabitans arisaemae]